MAAFKWTPEADAVLAANGPIFAAQKFGVSAEAAARRMRRIRFNATLLAEAPANEQLELGSVESQPPNTDSAPELVHRIVDATKRKAIPFYELCDAVDASPAVLREAIATAQSLGFAVQNVAGNVFTRVEPGPYVHAKLGEAQAGQRHRAWHFSDVHWGSRFFDEDAFIASAHEAWDRGCRVGIGTGDNLDGVKEFLVREQVATNADDQIALMKRTLKKIPPFTIVSITGNHDQYCSDAIGLDIGPVIERSLRDAGVNWTHVGNCAGRVTIHGASFHLHHPHGGTSNRNTIRRAMNAAVEHMVPEERPDFFLQGHLHKHATVLTFPEGVLCAAGGTFQQQGSTFGRRMTAPWDIGSGVVSWGIDRNGRVCEKSYEFTSRKRWPLLVAA